MITIVMGPTCSGKSTLIKNKRANGEFPGRVIDILDYQNKIRRLTVENFLITEERFVNDVVDALKRGEDVVIEKTLLKRSRRAVLMNAIKKIYPHGIIELYCMKPNLKTYQERLDERSASFEADAKEMMEFMELPDTTEGFDHVYFVE